MRSVPPLVAVTRGRAPDPSKRPTRATPSPAKGVWGGAATLPPSSLNGVFDRLDRASAYGLAGRLRGELLLLARERVDAFTRRAGGLLDDDELGKAVQDEDAVLLELLVPDVDQRLDDVLHVLAGNFLADRLCDRLQDSALRHRLVLLRRACFGHCSSLLPTQKSASLATRSTETTTGVANFTPPQLCATIPPSYLPHDPLP